VLYKARRVPGFGMGIIGVRAVDCVKKNEVFKI
jgi:hypothetical protein